ncbi:MULTISPECIES: hypothetical protein [Pasteurellaceae]|uniref:Uncharacterized protein n=1 Tax=Pasteurella atlantica TaxID=2827233 RepID=A0AAW8CPG7_9PAST|nr:hypothetical protein [Pasteurella atlantica]MBR0572670.1 hypothetical protein [Pasteurella atlantica]MDP8038615.1 hypothetical protein [Pasteurella atlantica]MDP8040707.1 hypothetical protein [Pasteurella atlantica]MDP8042842.1 hypothetical protein [Pasteurella atlantica]MDP8044929.1 hypothetical protein [Pasteurella atlantica]
MDSINDPKERFSLDRQGNFSNQKNVWCNNPDLKINKYNQKFNILEINYKNNSWGLPLEYSPNAIFCYEDKMYVYTYSHNYLNKKDIYTFYIYDYSGNNLANFEYAIDITKNSNKTLEYFEVQKDRFLIGLNTYSWYDQEKQEYRNQSYLFYELPKSN